MWNVSSSLADSLFSWANVVLIIGAALVLIGTIGSIKLAAIREHFADLRISDNERATKEAIAVSDVAKENAAKAAERAANSELARLKMLAELEPRSLTDEKAKVLIGKIRGKLREITLLSVQDQEAASFAMALHFALQEAGVTVHRGFVPATAPAFSGLVLVFDKESEGGALAEAFATIGFSAVWFRQPPTSELGPFMPGAPDRTLYVGVKQTPFIKMPWFPKPGAPASPSDTEQK